MKDFKILTQDDIPCWYEISWRKSIPAIVLRVHQDFIKNTKPKTTSLIWIDQLGGRQPCISQFKIDTGRHESIGYGK